MEVLEEMYYSFIGPSVVQQVLGYVCSLLSNVIKLKLFPHYSFLQIVLDVEFCLVKCLSVCSFDFGVTVSQHLVDYIWI